MSINKATLLLGRRLLKHCWTVHVGSAVAKDAKQGAEAGLNKGLDVATNVVDMQAHLERDQQAVDVATNIVSAPTNIASEEKSQCGPLG
jgi:hypothetical protein